MIERQFTSWDGVELYYRAWLPERQATRALVLFHRGHEHSGRFEDLVAQLDLANFAVFAWDARGHGKSPGERGWAESFASLVRDADCFVSHIVREYGISMGNVSVLAHSIGAVIAAAWVHDYAPPIRAMVLASPAFRVKLYVPFALPFLRLRLKFQPKAYVQSYVRPGMLTHDREAAESYARDPLISRAVSVKLLVDMDEMARRIVSDAAVIWTPTLVLSSGRDFVVRRGVQRDFFRRLASPLKEMREYDGFYHDLFHERNRAWPIQHTRDFLARAYGQQPVVDVRPANQENHEKLSRRPSALSPQGLFWGLQRLFLKIGGRLSDGLRTGWRTGFDSGESLDYIYRNRPSGKTVMGRLIDRMYLNSPGWRGIRQRKRHVEELLRKAILMAGAEGRVVHVFDPAAGGGRYVLDAVSRMGGARVSVTLRDWNRANAERAASLAREMKLEDVTTGQGNAFDRDSLGNLRPRPDVVVVSGLYELFADNGMIRESLAGLAEALGETGYLIYTNQPWHPQLEMIARVLDNRESKPWVMRCRSQAEMDALVREAGFEKMETLMDPDGIFTVSLAKRKVPAARTTDTGKYRALGGRT